jgi:hypothetical protein
VKHSLKSHLSPPSLPYTSPRIVVHLTYNYVSNIHRTSLAFWRLCAWVLKVALLAAFRSWIYEGISEGEMKGHRAQALNMLHAHYSARSHISESRKSSKRICLLSVCRLQLLLPHSRFQPSNPACICQASPFSSLMISSLSSAFNSSLSFAFNLISNRCSRALLARSSRAHL